MICVENTWIPKDDEWFTQLLRQSGGTYAIDHLNVALEHVTDWSVAIDGGAHVGTWTRILAERFQTVYAFEPQPLNFKCLTRNTQRLSNVIRIPQGLGGHEHGQTITMQSGTQNSGQWHIEHHTAGSAIRVTTLDHLRLDACGFLKLDLEGYEYHGLKGAERLLLKCKPIVLIEENGLSSRYELLEDAASQFLNALGAVEKRKIGHDKIFGW